VRGRVEAALFRALDALGLVVHVAGYYASNAVPPSTGR
jgi:hypothetical protein